MSFSLTTSILAAVRTGFTDVKSLLDSLVAQLGTHIHDTTTYTPTRTNSTNIAASTGYTANYKEFNDFVIVWGKFDIDVTATGNSVLYSSLPIASNLANSQDLVGVFVGDTTAQVGVITADTINDRATFTYQASSTANTGFFYLFVYKKI